jgi:beta-lactamase class A
MKFFWLIPLIMMLQTKLVLGQEISIPGYYVLDQSLSDSLQTIVQDLGLDKNFDVGTDGKEQISFAVIDLTGQKPKLAGVNYTNFIYPASVYKMYVAADVLHQIDKGKYNLTTSYQVKFPNAVDSVKEIKTDPRPLLKDGDKVTVNYLLDLMLTRSDNSAANCLIDLAGRKNINKLIDENGWHGSEVTRKFLSRKYEDPAYKRIRGTMTCALHAADFMFKIYNDKLISPWVSMQMKTFLGRQRDTTKLAAGLPHGVMFYHKTGWWKYWTNDVGIVDNGKIRYIISCFVPEPEEKIDSKLKILSERVYNLMTAKAAKENRR